MMDKRTAGDYISRNFHPDDRVALVVIRRREQGNDTVQRLTTAGNAAEERVQAWLRYENANRADIYIGMNAMRADAHGRTKQNVAEIRHVYLDIDEGGEEKLKALQGRSDIPAPSEIVESSPGKYQAIWRVEGFGKDQAEHLMRGMSRDTGADIAATDCSRVMRVPGFRNHKYEQPHYAAVRTISDCVYTPADFPQYSAERAVGGGQSRPAREVSGKSQSELDWQYVWRQLAKGTEPGEIARRIAQYRTDKPDPEYYANHTVQGAVRIMREQGGRTR